MPSSHFRNLSSSLEDQSAASKEMKLKVDQKSADNMRILIYAMNYAPELIGCGKYTSELASFLATQGAKIEVITTKPHYPQWKVWPSAHKAAYSSEIIDDVRIHRCPVWLQTPMRGLARAWAPISFALSSAHIFVWRCIRFQPTHILCIEPTIFVTPVALLMAKISRSTSILHVQDLEIDAGFAMGFTKGEGIKRLLFQIESFLLKAFDRIITISNQMARRLEQKGVLPEHITIIRNWIDTQNIYPLGYPSPMRNTLGFTNDDFIVLYSGSVGLKQGLHILIQAANLLSEYKMIRFVIAGEGAAKAELVAMEMKNVTFLPLQPLEKLNDLLNLPDAHVLPQEADIADLVLPSKVGGMLASGKPIIAMANPGSEIYEFLSADATLIPAGDASRLADAILSHYEAQNPIFTHRRDKLQEIDIKVQMKKFINLFIEQNKKDKIK